MKPKVLGPLRHACFACAGGCHGTDVVIADDERDRIAAHAAALGVADPFEGPHLRKGAGLACVFLQSDRLCAIHARFGIDAKPRVCRQYPLVAMHAGLDVRLGIDPGCLHAWRSWPDGPDVPDGTEAARSGGGQPMSWRAEEHAMIALLDPRRMTVSQALTALTDEPCPEGAAPAGFSRRLAQRLVDARLAPRIAHPDTADSLRVSLAHVAECLESIDPGALPELALGPQASAWAVEAARRVVYLRLPAMTRPIARGLTVLTGAVACGWADPDPARFGPALAAWTRVMRTPARDAVLGDDEGVATLLRGPESDDA